MEHMTDNPAAAEYFVADANLVVRRIGNETILVPITTGVGDLDSIYTLSDVASRVWGLLGTPVSLDHIVSAICAEYEVTSAVVAKDVSELLATLMSRNLVRAVAEPRP
jgi:coenzyme PQQ synthesis protein D (PqqD)